MGEYKVVIVIPAFNEENTIVEVVHSVKEYGDVIVVNDASIDSTEKNAENAGAIVVNHIENKGYDQSLNSGFSEAEKRNYDAVITFDADGQHSAAMLNEYIANLKQGINLVLGVRPETARVSEWIFMLYTQMKFNWKDPLCGMKGYSMELYRKQGYFDSYCSIGTELAYFGLLHNYSYVQLPIIIENRLDVSRFNSLMGSNWPIFKSLFNMVLRRNL
mgnify:CR=1 FL=1|jgi:glycosyltransferase involved in cell wall biosynthesis